MFETNFTDMAIFEKTIERDSSFIIQALFARTLIGDNYLGFGTDNPHRPVTVIHFTGENMQVWENRMAMQWFLNLVLEKNQQSDEFARKIIEDQHSVVAATKPFWGKKTLDNQAEVEEFLRLLHRGLVNVTLYYYVGLDERTPNGVKEIVMGIREKDDYFAQSAEFLEAWLARKGYMNAEINVLLPEELLNLPEREVLVHRSKSAVLIDSVEIVEATLEEFAQRHPEYGFKELFHAQERVLTFNGQIAQKGIARGIVRIIKNRAQLSKVSEGDILVSPMTTPDFVAAMQKASAFVTDEGGIMCHAAIIAREMKKPCVIGTKIATQVLKDGDRVEVDANSGIVRILEKAS